MEEIEKKIREIWNRIPNIICKGLCYPSCNFWISSKAELDIIKQHKNKTPTGIICPYLTKDETNNIIVELETLSGGNYSIWNKICPICNKTSENIVHNECINDFKKLLVKTFKERNTKQKSL